MSTCACCPFILFTGFSISTCFLTCSLPYDYPMRSEFSGWKLCNFCSWWQKANCLWSILTPKLILAMTGIGAKIRKSDHLKVCHCRSQVTSEVSFPRHWHILTLSVGLSGLSCGIRRAGPFPWLHCVAKAAVSVQRDATCMESTCEVPKESNR